MAFSSTSSVTASDLNNMLRGLHRDNASTSHTGDTNETTLSTTTITAGTMTATGGIHILAAGTTTGTTDTKTAKLYFGTAVLATVAIAGGSANDWSIEAWVYNTAAAAQRIRAVAYDGTALETHDYLTATEDTASNVTVKVTGTMGGTTDTITQTMFDIHIVQIA